jgi:small subunit ribosomal protein S8
MAIIDPIADMLIRLNNAGIAKHDVVVIPLSKIKCEIAKILKKEGYIKDFKLMKDSKQGLLKIYLKYTEKNKHAIYGIERVSKCSRREYVKKVEIKPVLNGLGIAILSTSKGVMTDRTARKNNVGGEVLCNVW